MGDEAHHPTEAFSAAGKAEGPGKGAAPLKGSVVPEVLACFLEALLKSLVEVPAGLADLVAHAILVAVLTLYLEAGVPGGPSSPGDHVLVNHFAYEDLSFLADDPSSSPVE